MEEKSKRKKSKTHYMRTNYPRVFAKIQVVRVVPGNEFHFEVTILQTVSGGFNETVFGNLKRIDEKQLNRIKGQTYIMFVGNSKHLFEFFFVQMMMYALKIKRLKQNH